MPFEIQAGTTEFLDEVVANAVLDARTKLTETLRAVGIETIAYLRSLIDPPEFRPGLARSRKTGALYQPAVVQRRGGIRETTGRILDHFQGPMPLVQHRVSVEGSRRAHPGHWADRSGQLALSYASEVVEDGDSIILVLSNSAEYAVYVEAHDGFFVLSGVLEDGGPVEQAFRAVAARLAPDWEIVIEPGMVDRAE